MDGEEWELGHSLLNWKITGKQGEVAKIIYLVINIFGNNKFMFSLI